MNTMNTSKSVTNTIYAVFALLALACFALSPTAQAGRPQPTPTPTPAPPGNSFPNGVREFTASNTFVVPGGVYKLLVEIWGAGGGGGGTSNPSSNGGGNLGGGGSAGAYTRGVLTVVPGTTITVIVGIGGPGGQIAMNGGDGGSSSVSNGSSSITSGGGHGGTPGTLIPNSQGAWGAPATPDPNWFGRGCAEVFDMGQGVWAQTNYEPFVGTVSPHGAWGAPQASSNVPGPGLTGMNGYVLITY